MERDSTEPPLRRRSSRCRKRQSDQRHMDIVGYRAHRRGEDKQQQESASGFYGQCDRSAGPKTARQAAETNQRRRERQAGLRAGGAELLGDSGSAGR